MTTVQRGEADEAVFRLPLPDEFFDRQAPFDPPAVLDDLHARGPVNPVAARNGGQAWLVTGHAEARTVLSDRRFSSDLLRRSAVLDMPDDLRERMTDTESTAGSFITMDPPDHTRYRRLLTGQFTVRRMRALTERIEQIVDERIDAMLAGGSAADLVAEFALPVPSLVICELLGVPYAERDRFQEWSARLLRLDVPMRELVRLRDEFNEYMRALVRRKRAEPADDMISGLIHHSGADPALTDGELANIANLLLIAGHETTANMLALGTFALLQHPAQLARLRAEPELADKAVEELLRHLSIIHIGLNRVTTEEVELGGVRIPEGSLVMISLSQANRDPDLWAEPDALDLARARSPHLAFGHGVHQCLGQQLARVEMTVGFTRLLARLPDLRLAVPPEEVPLRTDMLVYGVHALPVTWAAP